jgi:predicted nucleic acid-binding protein
VRLEILGGASKRDRRRLRTLLEALPLYLPDAATWNRLDSWVERAGDADQQFGVGDLLVAAIVADHEGELWANDSDFARMEKLGFVRRHTPPAVS